MNVHLNKKNIEKTIVVQLMTSMAGVVKVVGTIKVLDNEFGSRNFNTVEC